MSILDYYAAAPLEYRGHLIHLSVDGDECFTILNPEKKRLVAADWPALKVLIDEELGDV